MSPLRVDYSARHSFRTASLNAPRGINSVIMTRSPARVALTPISSTMLGCRSCCMMLTSWPNCVNTSDIFSLRRSVFATGYMRFKATGVCCTNSTMHTRTGTVMWMSKYVHTPMVHSSGLRKQTRLTPQGTCHDP